MAVLAYANAIDTLLTDEALRRRLADAGKQRAESMFTIPKMVEGCEKIYHEIC